MKQGCELLPRLTGPRSRKAPRPGGDRFGPAYPQDEPGRGTCDPCILPGQILSPMRNLHSGWDSNQNVPPRKYTVHFGMQPSSHNLDSI